MLIPYDDHLWLLNAALPGVANRSTCPICVAALTLSPALCIEDRNQFPIHCCFFLLKQNVVTFLQLYSSRIYTGTVNSRLTK